jgi:hypothetical protein
VNFNSEGQSVAIPLENLCETLLYFYFPTQHDYQKYPTDINAHAQKLASMGSIENLLQCSLQ